MLKELSFTTLQKDEFDRFMYLLSKALDPHTPLIKGETCEI